MSDALDRLTTALADRYAIQEELGAGAMATVYIAEDLKHKRKVAVKVLRPELAAVLGAERFLQEIETTANLQHPHILPLFDSGEADSFLYYVMPFIDGETLRDKLNRETQLGIDEAVKITTEVADALDYAHRNNVIHRDIKPENILLHDGRPMVADFGIALAVSAAAGGRMTETGLSLGTPHYMSPEQATAEKDLTNRSDIYSLGCVVYEMLTGEPPHTGVSAQAIVMKIVTEDVQPVTELRKSVPPNVAAAVATALEKLAADRFGTAKEFADALTNATFALPSTRAAAVAGASARGAQHGVSIAGFSLAALLAIVAIWGWLRPSSTAKPSVRRFVIAPASVEEQAVSFPVISPDGTALVYVGAGGESGVRRLYRRMLNQFDTNPIPGTEGAQLPFFSPDGQWVGFWANGALRKVPVDGGPVVTIAETGPLYGASWGSNGTIVFAGLLTGLRQVSASGGAPEILTTLGLDETSDLGHYTPEVLPGGDAVLFVSLVDGVSYRIAVASMATGEGHPLIEGASGARYVPTGHIMFARPDGSLWAVRFDLDRLRVRGEPALVMDQTVRVNGSVVGYAIGDDGTLVFVAPGRATASDLLWVDHTGAASVLPFPPQLYLHPRLSPNGRQVALTIRDPSDGREDIWLLDLDRGTRSRFTVEGTVNRWPVWTHNGSRIAFSSSRDSSSFDLFSKPADGSEDARSLLSSERLLVPFSWAAEQQALAYYEVASGQGDIWTLAATGTPSPIVTTPFDERAPMFSPDGRWLAYVSEESGRSEVYVRPYPGPGARISISSEGGIEPVWSRDGRALYYRRGERMMVVPIEAAGTFGSSRVLFQRGYAFSPIGRGNPNYDVAADGRFLMVSRAADEGVVPIHVVLNFFEELKVKVGRK